ncbi:MAG: puuP 2 [Bacillota bacterium]|jgi:amino acid transporter|nr:puuP 2 [Bacillota bacterium]
MEKNQFAMNEGLNKFGYEQSLKRVLTLRNLVFFGISYLAPTVIFNQYGVLTQTTQGMMALSCLITIVAVIFTAYSYAQMVKVYPVAGSAYTYVQRAVNPHLGFLTGWVVLLDYVLIPMMCYLCVGMYMNRFVPQVPTPVWIIISIAAMTVINIKGIEATSKFNTAIMVLQFAFTLFFIGIVVKFIFGGGGAGTFVSPENFYDAKDFTQPGLLAGAAIMAISFLGFDAVTTVAEETIEPEKNTGKAIFIICIGAGVVFTLIAYLAQLAWPEAWREMSDPDTGIFDLFAYMKTNYMSTVFLIIDNCASLACALTASAAVARILYGMGRDGALPKKFFGYVHPKYHTPVCNILLVSTLSLSAVIFSDNLFAALSLVSFGALSAFIMVNISVIFQYVIKDKKRSLSELFRYMVLPLCGAVISGYLFTNIGVSGKIVGGCWLLIGIIYSAATTNFWRRLPPDLKLE